MILLSFWPALKWVGLRLLRTERSYYGQVERAYQAQGIFIRPEQLLLAPMGGRVELLVKSGTRVPRGAGLVKIVNEDLKERLKPQMEAAQNKVAAHDREARLALARGQERVDQSQLSIDNHTVKLKKQLSVRNYVASRQLEEELNSLTAKRRQATEELARTEEKLALKRKALLEEQARIEEQFARAEEIIRAKTPGIVSFQLDGLEELCQKTRYSTLFAKELAGKIRTVKSETTIPVGEPVGRLIDNFQCQLALCFTAAEDFAQGQAIYLHLPTGLERGKVEKWSRSGDKTYLLCTLENYKPQWNDLRSLELELATERKDGVVVSSRALVRRQEKLGVWVRQEGKPVWKEVTVRLQTRERAVVEGLPSGEAVITNPRLLR